MDITFISDTVITDCGSQVRALSKALRMKNNDVIVILPYYEEIYKNADIKLNMLGSVSVRLPCGNYNLCIYSSSVNGTECIFVHNAQLYSRERLRGYPDDDVRSAVFCSGALEALDLIGRYTEYIFTDSENTALIPIYLKFKYKHKAIFKSIKSYHYVNSDSYRTYDKKKLSSVFGIFGEDAKIISDAATVNLTKAAIITATRVFVGENASNMLYSRSNDIHHTAVQFGFKIKKLQIGLDYDVFSPEKDNEIHKNFSSSELSPRKENKLFVQRSLYLEENSDIPLIVLFPSNNKGIITRVLHDMMKCDIQTIILSEKQITRSLHPDTKKTITINDISSQVLKNIFSAADLSIFGGFDVASSNPAYISAAYGCVPIVPSHRFFDYGFSYFNKLTYDGNGYTFDPNIPQDLIYTLWDALGIYRHDKRCFNKLIHNTMKKAFSVFNTAEILEAETEKTLYSFI